MKVNEEKKLHSNLLDRIVLEFSRGLALIDSLTPDHYAESPDGSGSIGAHFRHNIDFAANFLSGLEEGRINYNSRERDIRVETDPQYAKERILFLNSRFKTISETLLESEVLICSELDESSWYASSGARELEFIHSHTVHHYALIAAKLNAFGVEVSADFGVAPSTLKYWAERDNEVKVA